MNLCYNALRCASLLQCMLFSSSKSHQFWSHSCSFPCSFCPCHWFQGYLLPVALLLGKRPVPFQLSTSTRECVHVFSLSKRAIKLNNTHVFLSLLGDSDYSGTDFHSMAEKTGSYILAKFQMYPVMHEAFYAEVTKTWITVKKKKFFLFIYFLSAFSKNAITFFFFFEHFTD